jgi:hypothetical protein
MPSGRPPHIPWAVRQRASEKEHQRGTGCLNRRPGCLGLLGGAIEASLPPRTKDSADGSEAELADSL